MRTCYSPAYFANTPTASMVKLPIVAKAVVEAGLATLIKPEPLDINKLKRLHDPAYVDAFVSGEGMLASSQGWSWTEQIRDGVLAIHGGQLLAAQYALDDGIAANIAQGFHHAKYRSGSGFCTFNGLALVAQEFPNKKIFVLDCDEHCGDGTAEFAGKMNNLYNYSICGTDWSRGSSTNSIIDRVRLKCTDFSPYQTALTRGFNSILAYKPDLIIYQAGADPHIEDPLGTVGMTTDQMFMRDHIVFTFCKQHKLPVLFVLAGGYQTPIEDTLLTLHVNTFKAAQQVFGP